MFVPTDTIIAAALAHAATCQPLEACGAVIAGTFYPVPNRSTEHDAFVMEPSSLLALEKDVGPIEAYVHSHVYLNPQASDADRAGCERTGLPWLIVAWPSGRHAVIEPVGWRAPLVGRKWAWGTHDCLGLIRDGMQDYAGVTMPDYHREWMWWKNGGNMIMELFTECGFIKIPVTDPWQHCDVAGMQIRSPVVNHLGLFVEPDHLLHQMMGRNSVRDIYGGFYKDVTVLHLRHESLMT
jgi:proteasome lid subunit RPN8/RPN11